MNWSHTEAQAVRGAVQPVAVLPGAWPTAAAVAWAGLASTAHRMRHGEGALLAVNLSLIVFHGFSVTRGLLLAIVSTLTVGLMYAFNDLHDAAADLSNPKKDRALIAAYLEHRQACTVALIAGKLLTLALAFAALDGWATAMVALVMFANVVYSTVLKGVAVLDVAWCGLWGTLYAAVVGAPPGLLLLVGLMTAICHLFQTLDDRAADAASGIGTTAVRSMLLSRTVLATLSILLYVVL